MITKRKTTHVLQACNPTCGANFGMDKCMGTIRERERATRGDRVLFSSVGLWEGFLGVRITRIPYRYGDNYRSGLGGVSSQGAPAVAPCVQLPYMVASESLKYWW